MSDNTSNPEHNPVWGDPFQTVLDHLEENGIRYFCKREERRISFTMDSGTALMKCVFFFDKTGDVFQIRIKYPILVKEKFRPVAMEFLTRANFGLVIGSFETDLKDGEILFHSSYLMHEGRLEEKTIARLFCTSLGTADRYFPSLMRVLFAGETPAEAVDLAELDKFESLKIPVNPKSKPRSRRTNPLSKKSPRIPKPEDDHLTLETPTQDAPPPTPPTPRTEEQNGHEGDNKEGGGHDAA